MDHNAADAIRVSHEPLRSFAVDALEAVGMPTARAETLADLLVRMDLRGIHSHGTALLGNYWDRGYVRMLDERVVNPDPELDIVRETPVSVQVDGDGGLGYFPALDGTERAIEKATEQGIAVMATRNHNHFGGAGIYLQEAVDEDLLAFATSGHQLQLSPGDEIYEAAGGSPMAFCAPADEEEDILLDFGTMHDLYDTSPYRDAIAELAPGLVLRHIGMGSICQSWGGFLTGLALDGPREHQTYDMANQGALAIVFRIDLFEDPDRFKRKIDEYVRAVGELEPLDGFDESYLPGGVEAAREQKNRAVGVPVTPAHQATLETLADEYGLTVPWV
jgi:LDH2 family malate/lactate/ureidoglycolate dehydrogenase